MTIIKLVFKYLRNISDAFAQLENSFKDMLLSITRFRYLYSMFLLDVRYVMLVLYA